MIRLESDVLVIGAGGGEAVRVLRGDLFHPGGNAEGATLSNPSAKGVR